MGPGFFGLQLNPRWLEIISEVRNQVAGGADFPPNHHWAGRGWSYGLTNMVQWGMGLPLGLAVLLSWGWAAWRCLRGDWHKHLLPVVWVGGFFLYQNINFAVPINLLKSFSQAEADPPDGPTHPNHP